MADNSTINVTLEVDDKGTVKVRQFADSADKAGKKGSSAFGKLNKSLGTFNARAAAAKVGMAGVAAGAAALAGTVVTMKQAIDAASNLQEVTNKFSVVFSGQMDRANAWAQNLVDNYAMSTREARQYLASVQDLLVPMGMAADEAGVMSNQIVQLSADLGSFNNMPTAQVMENIQSALVGEYDSMKKYGVGLTATTVKQRAMSMGLAETEEALTAADKAQAAYALTVEGSQAAAGDMAHTMDSYANQVKLAKAGLEDFKAFLGSAFLPAAAEALSITNEWARANGGLAAKAKATALAVVGGIENVLGALKWMETAWLQFKLVGNQAFAAVIAGLDALFRGLRATTLGPLDMLMEGLKTLGVIDINPFEKVQQVMEDLKWSSKDVVDSVQADIEATGEKYDKAAAIVRKLREEIEKVDTAEMSAAGGAGASANRPTAPTVSTPAPAAEKTRAAADEVEKAYAAMYSDLGAQADGYYQFEAARIAAQAANFEKMTGDRELAYEWMTAEMKKLDAEMAGDAKTTFDAMEDAFSGWATGYMSQLNNMLWESEVTFDGILESFGRMVTQMMLQSAAADVTGALFGSGGESGGESGWAQKAFSFGADALMGYFGGGGGEMSTAEALADAPWATSAAGNVFSGPGIGAFSSQIVDRPTIFPFARGIGLMGEAGSEAIMPLTRTKGGDLGVKAEQPAPQVHNKIINVLDPSIVGDYLATSEGEQAVVNIIQRNREAL